MATESPASFLIPLLAGPTLGFLPGLLLGLALASVGGTLVAAWAYRKFVLLENRARDAERLAELGLLTGGLAHEIKNPLSTVQLNLQLLREDLADRDGHDREVGRMLRRLETVSNEASRLRDILDDFLRYAGRLTLEPVETDLNALAEEMVDFLTPQAQSARVRLRLDRDAEPVIVVCDPKLVKQAVLNLTLNALQHTPAGGEVILRVRADRRDTSVAIVDTGPGIPEADRPRIFDPYYSRRKGGTGLGLPMTRRIAEAHGGRVELTSETGKGSQFTLLLPRQPLTAPAA